MTPLDIIADLVGRDAPDRRAAQAIIDVLASYRWHFVQTLPENECPADYAPRMA